MLDIHLGKYDCLIHAQNTRGFTALLEHIKRVSWNTNLFDVKKYK